MSQHLTQSARHVAAESEESERGKLVYSIVTAIIENFPCAAACPQSTNITLQIFEGWERCKDNIPLGSGFFL